MPGDRPTAGSLDLDLSSLRAEVERLKAENARLLRLLADTGDIVEDLRTHMKGVTNLLNSTRLGPVV